MLVSFLLLLVLVLFALVAWFKHVEAGRPFTQEEAERLAAARHRKEAQTKYSIHVTSKPPDLAFKKAMSSEGRFHDTCIPITESLSTIASHLKHKRHEWMVFALCSSTAVIKLWCNKGPDSKSTYSKIPLTQLLLTAINARATAIMAVHNHPNSNPQRYSCLGASDADKNAGEYWSSEITARGLDFLNVVCERGQWLVFMSRLAHHALPEVSAPTLREELNVADARTRRGARSEIREHNQPWSSMPHRVIGKTP